MNLKADNKTGGPENRGASNKVLTVIGIILCVILVPILIVNVTMIVKSFVNRDKVPTFGGFAPLIVLTDSMNPPTTEEFKSIFPIDMTYTGEEKEGIRTVTGYITVNRTERERVLEVTVDGEKSMIKKIRSGDLIVIKSAGPEDVKLGDVISYFDPASNSGAVVTHRVIAMEYDAATGELLSFRTRGDSNNTADRESVPKDKLVGIWTGTVIGGAGKVAMFLQSTPGLIICIAVPVLLLVGYEVISRRREDKNSRQQTDELLAELEELRKMKEQKEKEKEKEQEKGSDETSGPADPPGKGE